MSAEAAPLRILIVDDEPPIRRFLRTSLGGARLSGSRGVETAQPASIWSGPIRSTFWSSISACPI